MSHPAITIETLTAGFARQSWPARTVDEAGKIACKLSSVAIDDPLYPNPFVVLESDGTVHSQYFAGAELSSGHTPACVCSSVE